MNKVSEGFGIYFQTQIDNLNDKIDASNNKIHILETIEIPKLNSKISDSKLTFWVVVVLFLAIIVILLAGCGGAGSYPDSGSSNQDKSIQKIQNWQNREKLSTQALEYKTTGPTGDLFADIKYIVRSFAPYIEPKEEPVDYWQTSQETFNRKKGDCEDLSILVYVILLDSDILDYYNADIFLRWIEQDSGIGHTFCIIKSADGQIVCIDNFYVSNGIAKYWTKIVADFDLYSIYLGGVKI